jgi:hypothetical protein
MARRNPGYFCGVVVKAAGRKVSKAPAQKADVNTVTMNIVEPAMANLHSRAITPPFVIRCLASGYLLRWRRRELNPCRLQCVSFVSAP